MSSLNRNSLKAEFVAGTAATAAKFEDLIDSSYNTAEDSLLLGPLGSTGTYGIYLSDSSVAPTSGSAGSTGELRLISTGSTAYAYLHEGTQWFRFEGATSF